ncbi:MAG TPA: glycosyltransferase family 4 protein [Anaerolineales bacterium]|nr:glycosyltransferase family 4 protein [Anaerolineales bacterium]
MRVLFVYKLLTIGGVETVLRTRLEGLAAHGIDSRAWFLQEGPGRRMFRGVEHPIDVGDLRSFRKWIAAQPPDLLASMDTPEILPALRRLRKRPKVVLEVHTPYRENQQYLRTLDPGDVDLFCVPSQHQRRTVESLVGEGRDIRVVPNALARGCVREIDGAAPRLSGPIVCWVGRMDELKNWRGFIEIAGLLRQGGVSAEYWLIGSPVDPSLDKELFQLAVEREMVDQLRWFRGVMPEHVPSFLDVVRESGGVVVSTSLGESFGMTVAEAMARACAVVVPHLGPFSEYVRSGENGLLYTSTSSVEAAGLIRDLLARDELRRRLGSQARIDILERHHPDVALPALAEQLRQIASSSPS